jgi:hypothetical protein
MYGGSDGERALDELWIYHTEKDFWELLEIEGLRPAPRYGHAATAKGYSLVIWGGRNGNEYYNDMFLYNILTNQWEEMAIEG